ncbi:hypothetical protein E1263_27270 [Kribbella antibiotica]|uniref:Uncharacterized protein n=1 Tax=Kribbella antibiotica TaxID=190195 RepID=A0A4R4Z9T7_9ACTN|nr:hypothetical protein [Kribbella antibiotica]TDD54480.1 hypothetical protein E1263_27270 [Kribbella antibiotica]
MSQPPNSEPLTEDEVTANDILAPFDIQVVRVNGEFTRSGNVTGLQAAYLHLETAQQIPQSVKKSINGFDERRQQQLTDCVNARGYPWDPNVAKNPIIDTKERVVYEPGPPSEVFAACLEEVNARYGFRDEGDLADILLRAKGPDAKLYGSE